MFVDLLLSKNNHNGAAARRFLLVLGATFDERKLRRKVYAHLVLSQCVAGLKPAISTRSERGLLDGNIEHQAMYQVMQTSNAVSFSGVDYN